MLCLTFLLCKTGLSSWGASCSEVGTGHPRSTLKMLTFLIKGSGTDIRGEMYVLDTSNLLANSFGLGVWHFEISALYQGMDYYLDG